MIKLSKNKKLNNALNTILDDVLNLDADNVKHYYFTFKNEAGYNLAQYGNLLVYYYDIKNMYKKCGYKSIDKMSDGKVWEIYKRQVGYITRYIINNNLI